MGKIIICLMVALVVYVLINGSNDISTIPAGDVTGEIYSFRQEGTTHKVWKGVMKTNHGELFEFQEDDEFLTENMIDRARFCNRRNIQCTVYYQTKKRGINQLVTIERP